MKKFANLKNATKGTVLALALPMVVAAAETVSSLITTIKTTINSIIGILMGLALLYFVWGIVKYMTAGGDETKIKAGKSHMLYGIIGLVVMAAVWGIVGMLVTYIGGQGTTVSPPQF